MTEHEDYLSSWNDVASRHSIEAFVHATTYPDGPHYLPPEARIAVFDNDGTLWCEKPMPVEIDFILQRLAAMAQTDQALASRQPFKVPTAAISPWSSSCATSRRVIGSSAALRYQETERGGSVVHGAAMDVFDDGIVKPVRIWSRIGRRPVLTVGNSNGDIPMLQYCGGTGRPRGVDPARARPS